MNPDEHLHDHLSMLAGAIELTPGDVAEVRRRGSRRRNRRRAAVAGVSVVALAATTFTVIDTGDDDRSTVESDVASPVVATPYDWTVVSPNSGLGYSSDSALVGSSVYRLSTAPGPVDDGRAYPAGSHLYRSDDGTEWSEVALPDGLRASALGAADGALYAIGTAPAGGDARELVVAASTDGAATWSNLELPADVADLEQRFPGQISIGQPSIAALDAQHLVATVSVATAPDVEALLPEIGPNESWELTSEGVTVYEHAACVEAECEQAARGVAGGDSEPESVVAMREAGEPKAKATYSWDELGLDPELRELIDGRTYVYASSDGASFAPVDLPGAPAGGAAQVSVSDAGFHLYTSPIADGTTTSVLHSADGTTWTEAGSFPGWVQAAGELAGRPAVAISGAEATTVRVGQPDGTWTTLDLLAAVDGESSAGWIGEVDFGPLGVLATVFGENVHDTYVVHSDGTSVSSIRIADHIEDVEGVVTGVDVTADALMVRVADEIDGDPTTPPGQLVLVGTPR